MLYKDFLDCVITTGIKHKADNLKCYWLISDIIAVSMTKFKGKEHFLNCVICPDLVKKTAILKIDDGNGKELYTQKYQYTDLNENLKIWSVFNELGTYTLMLPEEY